MNHLKWLGHASTLLDMQKNLQSGNELCDVKLISGNGKIMYAHKAILFSSSDFFRTIFKNISDSSEICTILIPDIKDTILSDILDFIYTGSISLLSINLSEFLENINILGIKSAISFECHVTNNKLIKADDSIIFEHAVIQEDHEETIEKDQHIIEEDEENEDIDPLDSSLDTDQKSIQYLEVFNAGDNKIEQYGIQSATIEENASGDYILTENPDNTFTLTEQKIQLNESVKTIQSQSDISSTVQSIKIATVPSTTTIKPVTNKPKFSKQNIKTENLVENIDYNDDIVMAIGKPSTSQGRSQAFESAVRAVIDEGISLQKAAEKYHISKTVLWRRVKKNPSYNKTFRENPIIEAAIQKLEKGETLKSVSQSLNIPMSTLHRHKMRLAEEGRLPKHIQIKRRDLESKENAKMKLSQAVVACINGMSQNHAAVVYQVPKSTLWRHLQRKTVLHTEVIENTESSDEKISKTKIEDVTITPFTD